MRIAELYALRKFRLVDGPVPAPGPGEVQVHVEAVGICGSDLHNFSEGKIGDTPCQYPMVLGHEPAGVVVKTGAGVTGWAPGDRAALEPALYCYHCEFCLSGRHNICANIRFLSSPVDPGFFREFVNLPAGNLLPLPKGVGFKEGTLFEPLAVALHSMKFAALAAARNRGGLRCGPHRPVDAHRAEDVRRGARLGGGAGGAPPGTGEARGRRCRDRSPRGGRRAADLEGHRTAGRGSGHRLRGPGEYGQPRHPGHPQRRAGRDHRHSRGSCTCPWSFTWPGARNWPSTTCGAPTTSPRRRWRSCGAHAALFAPILTHTLPLEKVQPAFEMLETYSDGAVKVILQP